MFRKLRTSANLLSTFGVGWALFRVIYNLSMKAGLIQRRTPPFAWADRPLRSWLSSIIPSKPVEYAAWREQNQPPFLFTQLPSSTDAKTTQIADAILSGRWTYFSSQTVQGTFPPDWHLDPFSGVSIPATRHWSQIPDFGNTDIKFVWELNRFDVVYPLLRAYAISGDERYAEGFWLLIEDWKSRNPPMLGPNWKCGQEISIRALAWCFALYGFQNAEATTPERVASLAQMLAVSAERVERNIGYAYNTRSNHGISESMGLWLVGTLFPEFKRSSHWRQTGRRFLQEELERQCYLDGTYSMLSLNYQRSVLRTLAFVVRLGECVGTPFPEVFYTRLAESSRFLEQIIDPSSGRAPNYGSNDGTAILPLNSCNYEDYRPTLQLIAAVSRQGRRLASGPWDEDLLWFGIENPTEPTTSFTPRRDFPIGGFTVLKSSASFAFIHCGLYKDRPSHSDQLHVDLRWRNQDIAIDAGTYRYHAPPPWDNGLSRTDVHNTITVDSRDPMDRVSLFTWVNWAQGTCLRHEVFNTGEIWEGMHNGYAPVRHLRAIVRWGESHWAVIDKVSDTLSHEYRLHWLLANFPAEINADGIDLHTPAGLYACRVGTDLQGSALSVITGDPIGRRGWQSTRYLHKEPVYSLALLGQGTAGYFWTIFSPELSLVKRTSQGLRISGSTDDMHLQFSALPDRVISIS